ncbi:methyl-accepting chemotaxis protein [candidate division WOR-3 bacterium]|nr:methyl-accepting chemotaxis protein [candidate division WOR-3 bacterium]
MEKRRILWYLLTTNLISLIFGIQMILFFTDSVLVFSVQEISKFFTLAFSVGIVLSIIHFLTHLFLSSKYSADETEDTDNEKKWLYLIKKPYISSYHIMFNLFLVGLVIVIYSSFQLVFNWSLLLVLILTTIVCLFFSLISFLLGNLFLHPLLIDLSKGGFTFKNVKNLPFTLSIKLRFSLSFTLVFLFSLFVGIFLGKNIGAIAISIIAIFTLGFLSVYDIIKRINVLKISAINLAEGEADLTMMLPVIIPDEISNANEAFNKFTKRLDSLIVSIFSLSSDIIKETELIASSSEQLNASIEEISSTINEVSHGAQEQSTKSNEIYKEIEKLSSITSGITSQMKMAVTSARKANSAASTGMEASISTLEKISKIYESSKKSSVTGRKLEEDYTKTEVILNLINDISEQTNILALNAAIEAARVGEYGRGFAVVAEEIRKLAIDSANSVETVSQLINSTREGIKEVVSAIEEGATKTEEGKVFIDKSEKDFEQISKTVTLVTTMINQVSESTEEQNESTKQLVASVEKIASIASDTAASSQEVSASIEEQTASTEEMSASIQTLANKVKSLLESISLFKVSQKTIPETER